MEETVAPSIKRSISDLHLCSVWPTRWRIHGRMEAASFDTPDIEELLREWLDDDQRAILLENSQLDPTMSLAENQRLRGNTLAQRQGVFLALRLLPSHYPQLERLGVSLILSELLRNKNGLILVTGATGSGKPTTLTAMIGYLNQHVDAHVLTLEDPAEYLYTSQRCLVQQWEIGLYCMTFAPGLRAALWGNPDMILFGELRDSETIHLTLTVTGTGHLVLATLHTRGATQAVERLVDSFPAQEGGPVYNQLAGSLRAVLSQKPEMNKQEGCVTLFGLLISTPAVGNLIREGKTHQLPYVIQTGQQIGMIALQQSYQQRVEEGCLQRYCI